jgi:hypothetical protein
MNDGWIKQANSLGGIVISTAVEKSFKLDFDNLLQRFLSRMFGIALQSK